MEFDKFGVISYSCANRYSDTNNKWNLIKKYLTKKWCFHKTIFIKSRSYKWWFRYK